MAKVKTKNYDLFIAAAKELSIAYEVLDEERAVICFSKGEREFYMQGSVTSFNSTVGRNISIYKDLALRMLDRQHLPIPQSACFCDRQEAKEYAEKHSFPIVIKPADKSCAIGVTINPVGKEQISVALDEAFTHGSSVMVEEFIEGLDYRITIFDGEIIAVTYRAPGFVAGDGARNLQELIDKKNEERKEFSMPPITIRGKDLRFLSNRNLDLDYTPSKEEHVRLQLGCDRDIGGERHRIDLEEIPSENRELFLKIAEASLLRLVGIDFIIPDITKSYRQQKCGVNEVNHIPAQSVHYYDTLPGDNYSCRRILRKFFKVSIKRPDVGIINSK